MRIGYFGGLEVLAVRVAGQLNITGNGRECDYRKGIENGITKDNLD